LIMDATRQLLKAGSSPHTHIPPEALAEVLDNKLLSQMPKLSASHWESVFQRLITGRRLEAAETLLLQLISHPGFAARAPELLKRLILAFEYAGRPEKTEALKQLADRFSQRSA